MGFLRKGLFVATGGVSGAAGIKANSKKERTAKALEAQNRAAKQASRTATPTLAGTGVYHFSNYDGGFPFHPSPEKRGTLKFVDSQWQLHFGKANHSCMVVSPDTRCRSHPRRSGVAAYRAGPR